MGSNLQAQISGVVPYLSPASTFAPFLIKQLVQPRINQIQIRKRPEEKLDQTKGALAGRPEQGGAMVDPSSVDLPIISSGDLVTAATSTKRQMTATATATATATSRARSKKTGLTSAPAATKSSATARLSGEQQCFLLLMVVMVVMMLMVLMVVLMVLNLCKQPRGEGSKCRCRRRRPRRCESATGEPLKCSPL